MKKLKASLALLLTFAAVGTANTTLAAAVESDNAQTQIFTSLGSGDLNGDDVLDINDATLLQKYLAQIVTSDNEQLSEADADVDRNGEINIIDVTQIQKYAAQITPRLDSLTQTSVIENSSSYAIYVQDNYLYQSKPSGTKKVDISDPENPIQLKKTSGHTGYYSRGMAASSEYLYVPYRDSAGGTKTNQTTGIGGYLDIIRLSDFKLVNTIAYPHEEITLYGKTAYFGKSHNAAVFEDKYLCVTLQFGGWILYDISQTPENPKQVYKYNGRADSFNSSFAYEYQCPAFFKDDNGKLYLAISGYSTDLLRIYDLSDVSGPVEVFGADCAAGGYSLKTIVNGKAKSYIHTMSVTASYPYLYCTIAPSPGNFGDENAYSGIAVVDVSDISDIKINICKIPELDQAADYKGEPSPATIAMYGNYIVTDNYDSGIAVWSIENNPANPDYLGSFSTESPVWSIDISTDGKIYASCKDSTIRVYDGLD